MIDALKRAWAALRCGYGHSGVHAKLSREERDGVIHIRLDRATCPECGRVLSDKELTWRSFSLDKAERLLYGTPEEQRAERVREALRELVDLKAIKDTEGKTPEYERRQPLAWQRAREALGE